MRNVISTNAYIEVSEEYSEQIDELLGKIDGIAVLVLRETYRGKDSDRFHIRLLTYRQPGSGERVYAVEYYDGTSHEVEETADEAEATARYEESVRDAYAGAAPHDDEPWVDYSDVEGISAREHASA